MAARAVPAGGQLVCVGGIATVAETAPLLAVDLAILLEGAAAPQVIKRRMSNQKELIERKNR